MKQHIKELTYFFFFKTSKIPFVIQTHLFSLPVFHKGSSCIVGKKEKRKKEIISIHHLVVATDLNLHYFPFCENINPKVKLLITLPILRQGKILIIDLSQLLKILKMAILQELVIASLALI